MSARNRETNSHGPPESLAFLSSPTRASCRRLMTNTVVNSASAAITPPISPAFSSRSSARKASSRTDTIYVRQMGAKCDGCRRHRHHCGRDFRPAAMLRLSCCSAHRGIATPSAPVSHRCKCSVENATPSRQRISSHPRALKPRLTAASI